MRLQRQVSRKAGDRTYYKFILTVPEDLVRSAGWVVGDRINGKTHGSEIILTHERSPTHLGKMIERQTQYEQFKERICRALRSSKEGLTWTELRAAASLSQRVPNNVWVRRLEEDSGLVRAKSSGKGTVWRLSQ